MNAKELLKIYRAVAGPVAENNVDKAVSIIKNSGRIPQGVSKNEIRTWQRVKERLKSKGLI